MKKADRVARDLENTLNSGVDNARDWAAPRVEAALNWAKPRLEKGFEQASPRIQDGLRKAASATSDGVATVTPRIQEGLDKLAPRLSDAMDSATPRIQDALDRATPALNSARDRVVGEYIPLLSEKLGEAAGNVGRALDGTTIPPQVEAAVTRVTGNKRTLARAKKATADAAKQAAKDLRKKQKSGRKGWLIVGVITAAVAAGAAVWKASQPIEDPWKTPAPLNPTVPAKPAGADTKDAEKKDPATEVLKAANNASNVVVDKVKTAVDDVKDALDNKSTESAHEGANADSAETAKHSAVDKPTDAKDAMRNIASNMQDKSGKPDEA